MIGFKVYRTTKQNMLLLLLKEHQRTGCSSNNYKMNSINVAYSKMQIFGQTMVEK